MAGLPDVGSVKNHDPNGSDPTSGSENTSQDGLECPICMEPCVHPVELPCRHIFCFLCIKGVAMQGPNGKCAICRATIPSSVLTNPQLKDVSQLYKEPKSANGYQWYYESRGGGWWQYDERTMNDLEREYSSNKPTCQLLLAGHLYIVDFVQMTQYRLNNHNVSRRIRRELNLEKRGVAGIRIAGQGTGAGTSGGANNGSPPPPNQQGPGASTRRRRGIQPAGNSQPPTASSHNHPVAVIAGSNPLPSVRPPNAINPDPNGDSPAANQVAVADSDDDSIDEDEDYDSDYSDVDEDMELGEEEEALIGDDSDERETEDEEEYEARDGARAPTRRSDRSNSSNNQTPPPPSGTGMANGSSGRTYSPNPNGRGSRSARSGRSSGGGRSSNGTNGASSRSGTVSEPLSPILAPQSSASSNVLHLSHKYNQDNPMRNNVSNINNNNIYLPLDDQIFGQVLAGNGIASTSGTVKITFERHSHRGREEFL